MFVAKDLEETFNIRARMLAVVRQEVKLKSVYYDSRCHDSTQLAAHEAVGRCARDASGARSNVMIPSSSPSDPTPAQAPALNSGVTRAGLLGHEAAILWLTGLSGAGKSTLATALEAELLRARVLSVVLDGDLIRSGLSRDLGFSADDRSENIRRTGEAAALVAAAGAVAIVALISPFRADRGRVADRAGERGIRFAEIYVNAPLAVCEQRDPKALYRRARAGEIRDLTGIGSPYEEPLAPDLELRTDIESVPQSLEKLTQFALALVQPNRHASSSLRHEIRPDD